MKKTLIALAAVAAVGGASAQVTLYGTVDAGVASYSQDGYTKTGLFDSQLGSSKLGFMGTEDLGGGLSAIFKLEGGLANDSGNGKASSSSNLAAGTTSALGAQGVVFQRFSYVGLAGGFGEVRMGRDYTNVFLYSVTSVDPFGTNGPASSSAMTLRLGGLTTSAATTAVATTPSGLVATATTTNVSNSIAYTSPAIGGVTARLQAFAGETANSTNGSGYSAQAQYVAGPILLTGGQQVTTGTAATTGTGTSAVSTPGDYTQSAIGGTYDFGMAKAWLSAVSEQLVLNATAKAKNDSVLVGLTVPVGAWNYKLSYIQSTFNNGTTNAADFKGTLTGLGVDYALSKRTKLYATAASVTNDAPANSNISWFSTGGFGVQSSTAGAGNTKGSNTSSTGVAIGINHSF